MDKHSQNENYTSSNELKNILNILEAKTFKFILWLSCAGILIVFATSIFNTKANKYYEVANAMNMLISIIVGIVAMAMSIISLFFSFYNTKQSYDTHDDYLEKFINIANSLDQTIKKQEENIASLNKLSDKLGSIDDKMSTKFDKMFDMIHSLDKTTFTQVTPKATPWLNDKDINWDWDFDIDNDSNT